MLLCGPAIVGTRGRLDALAEEGVIDAPVLTSSASGSRRGGFGQLLGRPSTVRSGRRYVSDDRSAALRTAAKHGGRRQPYAMLCSCDMDTLNGPRRFFFVTPRSRAPSLWRR